VLIRIATRRSKLALAQSHWVKSRLEALDPQIRVELREFVTRGDRIQDVPLQQVGGKGLFTREIEEALLSGEAEIAVHSLKDLPSELPSGLMLGAVPTREDPRDVIVLPREKDEGSRKDEGGRMKDEADPLHPSSFRLHPLKPGARVGSSSLRRSSQLRHVRPDLQVESVRGNVDTRLRKLDEGQYDALVLAAAGLIRLGLGLRISDPLPVEVSTPAPGQGALGLECREADDAVRELLSRLEDPVTRRCVAAERALMDAVGGGCSVPLGALATACGETLHLVAVVASPDGTHLIRRSSSGPPAEPEALGRTVAEMLFAAGARDILTGTHS
jgi:hydroxymethylbilane synthase